MKRTVDSKYWFGDIVYLRVNDDCKPGMITRVTLNAAGSLLYLITWRGGTETGHFECELSGEYVPDYGVCESSQEQQR